MGSFVLNHRIDLVAVSVDETHSNVLHIDRDVHIILVQITPDCYELRKGRWHIGDVTFGSDFNGTGWQFHPRSAAFRPTKRYRFPEWAVRRKFKINAVYGMGTCTAPA